MMRMLVSIVAQQAVRAQKSSCNLEGCLNLNLPDTIMSSAGLRNQTFAKIMIFSKDRDFGYPAYLSIQQRHFTSPKPKSTPIYLKTLSLLC